MAIVVKMFLYQFHSWILYFPDTWYVLKRGRDKDGCGRTPGSACSTLLYLLQQVNRTHPPPSTGIRISTDKCITIDQQAAVSTISSVLQFVAQNHTTESDYSLYGVFLLFCKNLKICLQNKIFKKKFIISET